MSGLIGIALHAPVAAFIDATCFERGLLVAGGAALDGQTGDRLGDNLSLWPPPASGGHAEIIVNWRMWRSDWDSAPFGAPPVMLPYFPSDRPGEEPTS